MLKDNSLPLREIALRCGFADQAYFTRSFGQAKGTPPAAWRRERSASSIGMFHGGSKSGDRKIDLQQPTCLTDWNYRDLCLGIVHTDRRYSGQV